MTELIRTSLYNPVPVIGSRFEREQKKYKANIGKVNHLKDVVKSVIPVMNDLVNELLYSELKGQFADKELTDKLPFTARLSQVVGKMAIGQVKSIQNKVKLAEKAKKKKKYQKELLTKWNSKTININVKDVNLELDSRFVEFIDKPDGCWLKISSLVLKKKVFIPIKFNKHMDKLIAEGYTLCRTAIRLYSNGRIGLYFKKPEVYKEVGDELGIDLGKTNLFYLSNGQCDSGKTSQLIDKINGMKKGTTKSKRARSELRKCIDKELKAIPFKEIKTLFAENLASLGNNRWNKAWIVGYIRRRLAELCETNDVRLAYINPAYTSQTCSRCGNVDSESRSNSRFSCTSCYLEINADLNAAINIATKGSIVSLSKKSCYNNL